MAKTEFVVCEAGMGTTFSKRFSPWPTDFGTLLLAYVGRRNTRTPGAALAGAAGQLDTWLLTATAAWNGMPTYRTISSTFMTSGSVTPLER